MHNYELNDPENVPPPPLNNETLPAEITPASPDNPPWNSWAAFFVWLASVAFVVLIPNLFILFYLSSRHLDFSDKAAVIEFAQTDPTAILLQLSAILPAHILTFLLAWLVVTRFRKFSFRETLGWRWNGFNIWYCAAIIGGFYVLAGITSYYFPEQENDLLRILKSSRSAVYLIAFLATVTAPFIEELVYRGVLYSAFQRTIGVPLAVLMTTFLFAVVHVPQYYPSYSTIFLICLLSLVLTLIRARTKNLLPCIALHTVFNGSQSLLLILQPFVQNYIENHPPQPGSILFFFQ